LRLAAASLLALSIITGCFVEAPPPAAPPPKPKPQVAAAEPAPPPAPVESAPEVAGLEPGYEYCCGNDEYRLDIGCGYLDMRCYEATPDGWVRTYGRHCKAQLGTACYLNGCDDRCD
jgi:hypothetical protein